MNKASPADMKKALDAVHEFRKAGILFVPIPVLDESDHREMLIEMLIRINKISIKTALEVDQ